MTAVAPERIRILHVDDDPDMTEVTAEFLERADGRFEVATAESASAGLDRLGTEPVDCVVSDYDMPGMDGNEFLAAVRETHPDLPFFLFTGKGDEGVASRAISAGVTDYLQKGPGTEQYELLANRIGNAVEGARAERRRQRQVDAIETAREGISILDDDGRFVYVNEAYAGLYGYEPSAMLGEHWSLVYIDDDVPEMEEEILPTVAETGHWHGETVGLRADGSTFIEDHSLATTEDGGLVCTVRDVTEQRERERDLEQRESHLRQAQRVADVGSWRLDLAEDRLFWSDHVYEIFGAPADEELTYERFLEYVHPEDRETVQTEWEGGLETGEYAVEHRVLTGDGETRWVRERAEIEFEAGKPTEALGIVQDVTERRDRERALREEQAFVEQALNAIDDIFYVIDASGDLKRVNDRACEVTGYSEAELLSMDPTAFFEPADQDRVQADIEEALETGTASLRAEMVTGDGETVPYEFRKRRLTDSDGDTAGVVGIGRDVSDREERERQLGALFDNAPVAIAYTEFREGTPIVRDANAAFEETFGYDADAIAGESIDDLVVPADRGPEADSLNRRVEAGEQFESEVRRETPEGLRDFLLHSVPLSLEEPGDQAYAMYNDVTERNEYKRQLERQNERLEEFAGIVSHDLRNPLRVAQGRLELAGEDCDSEHLAAVAGAHDRMATLIEDLLALARQGEDVDAVEPVELGALVAGCWDNVETASMDLSVETDLVLEADRGRLKQLLENLFRNAREHAGPEVAVTVGDLPGGFYVADDGPGIPEGQRERVFEPGESTSGGSGFGLSIVESIATAHGWDLAVANGEAGGARFEVTGVDTA